MSNEPEPRNPVGGPLTNHPQFELPAPKRSCCAACGAPTEGSPEDPREEVREELRANPWKARPLPKDLATAMYQLGSAHATLARIEDIVRKR